jgi:hypothetical protein
MATGGDRRRRSTYIRARITTTHVADIDLSRPDDGSRSLFASDARRAYDQNRWRLARCDLAGVAAVFQLVDGEATQRFAGPSRWLRCKQSALRTFCPVHWKGTSLRHRTPAGRTAYACVSGSQDQVLELSASADSIICRRGFGRGVGPKRADRTLRQLPALTDLSPPGSFAPICTSDTDHPASVAEQFDLALDDVLDRSVAPADVVATAAAGG